MLNALIVEKNDDVVVVTQKIMRGEKITYRLENEEKNITAIEDIPIYHKVAIQDIERGNGVKKYNSLIGRAISNITIGMHVHCHNIESIE